MQFTEKQFYNGEVIFSESLGGKYAYIVKEGSVEISIIRDDKKIILDELGAGTCFGEMAPISGDKRSATATATSFTEVYVLDDFTLNELINSSNNLLKAIVHSLIKRLKRLNESAVMDANPTHKLLVYTRLLKLIAEATPNQYSTYDNVERDAKNTHQSIKRVSVYNAVKEINNITGDSRVKVMTLLRYMKKAGIIDIIGIGYDAKIWINTDVVLKSVKDFLVNAPDSVHKNMFDSEFEWLNIDELTDMLQIGKEETLEKFLSKELPDHLLAFCRSHVLDYIVTNKTDLFEQAKAS